ncbi:MULTISPECIES: response regulator [Paraburkholderia]|jgi:two-component system response regulator ChvI|uniref:response regulator n=1 Tax=Paraburkholderia TaxID=1822464 RepID=UPI000B3410AF|nr:response regulator [Paraburkholderia hospita]AXF03476.1 response regulator [Paraburkholderia hospita]OUL97587.1 response regulator [Paraburkholderia hospita]
MPTVLLVDDDVETLDAWQGVCEAHGYATCLAEDGRTALDMLRERDVDVVVADWRMPVMSGSVLCHHVRHEQNLAEIVFILVSGEPSPPAFVYYDGFLRKPLDPTDLLSAMDRLLLERAADGRRRRNISTAPKNG